MFCSTKESRGLMCLIHKFNSSGTDHSALDFVFEEREHGSGGGAGKWGRSGNNWGREKHDQVLGGRNRTEALRASRKNQNRQP